METISIDKNFEREYGLSFSDKERKAFLDYMKRSNIDQDNFRIVCKSNPKAFMTEVTLFREFNLASDKDSFWYESVVFALKPMTFPVAENFNITNGGSFKYNTAAHVDVEEIDGMNQNIVIIKVVKCSPKIGISESFRIVIYNTEMEIVADGIRFV